MFMATGLKRILWVGLLALGTWYFSACQENILTTLDGDLIPVEAVTVELTIPFNEFARDLQAWGGYGQTNELAEDIVANGFEETLDARVLNSLYPYPLFTTVRDSLGVFGPDSSLTFIGATVVVNFDTLSAVHDGPVTVALSHLPRSWDARSTTWHLAVDSVGDSQAWDEAGAGPATLLATAEWDPATADSVIFQLDSAQTHLLADTAGTDRGLRVESLTEGTWLDMNRLIYTLKTRPSSHPDTLVDVNVASQFRTFIYDPVPLPPGDEIRVGGVPAWRSVFTMDLPKTLDGIPELCQVVQCPYELNEEALVGASLILTTQALPPAFLPRDTLRLDVRPVLEPDRLPKSPLGTSLTGLLGIQLAPDVFTEDAGVQVEVPIGPYVEGLIAVNQGEEVEVPHTLALLSSFEPLSLYFAAFEGPDSPFAPRLRLILTIAEDVRIR